MKKLFKTIAAFSASAILAGTVSSLTASAYPINQTNQQLVYLGTGYPCLASQTDQQNMPWLTGNLLSANANVKLTVVPKHTSQGDVFGQPGKYVALFDRYVGNENNLAQLKQNVDKLTVFTDNAKTHPCGTILECLGLSDYSWFNPNTLSNWSLKRFTNNYNVANEIECEDFVYNRNTGKFSCDFYFYDGYIPGLKLSSDDSYANFSSPELILDDDYLFYTKIHCQGRFPFKDSILFQNSTVSENVTYTIFNKITCTYNGGSSTTQRFKQTCQGTYAKNKIYDGIRGGSDLITKTNASQTNDFRADKFVGFHSSGSTLYICVGKNEPGINDPRWLNGSGEDKLKGFLTCGYRESFKRNNWLMNNLNNYTQIYFYSNSTENSYGTSFHSCSKDRLVTLLNMSNNS